MANFKGITLPDGTTYFPEGSGSAIDTVSVSVDNNTGVPSATGSVSNGVLTLDFQNIKGEQGPQGKQGPQGPAGATGATPNIQIGDVTTLQPDQQATASITGTPENPLLNFGIPQGQAGAGENLIVKQVTLASGTIPAGQTAVNDDSFIDTGLTLSDLKQYKYFIIRIRLDDARPYLEASIKNNRIFYNSSNAVFALCEIDGSEKNILKILGGVGNSSQTNPTHNFLNNSLGCIGGIGYVGSIRGMLSIPSTLDNEHLYVGIGNMNNLDSTKFNATWDVVGIAKFG